ncbi:MULTISPECIES: hypothetical protein [unclassified Streptomyces]|uniref:hypothetical protein n=1 Tax=unclassified Streptomyces TaxID=2593676 RepID=UPI000DC3D8BC|nr:hypothetical protein [Streptomyces sp. PsTaAH-130]RAJ57687.1 hypothetical protein K376_03711 [Streptomyces sp. PsTaAH-130]
MCAHAIRSTAAQDLPAADQGLAGALTGMSTQIGTALGIAFLVSLAERHPGGSASGIALVMRWGAVALAVAVALTLAALRDRRCVSRPGPSGA